MRVLARFSPMSSSKLAKSAPKSTSTTGSAGSASSSSAPAAAAAALGLLPFLLTIGASSLAARSVLSWRSRRSAWLLGVARTHARTHMSGVACHTGNTDRAGRMGHDKTIAEAKGTSWHPTKQIIEIRDRTCSSATVRRHGLGAMLVLVQAVFFFVDGGIGDRSRRSEHKNQNSEKACACACVEAQLFNSMAQDDSKHRPQRLVEYFISVGVGDEAQPLENVTGTSQTESGACCCGGAVIAPRGVFDCRACGMSRRGWNVQKRTNPSRMS
jgi:hypothetical protein